MHANRLPFPLLFVLLLTLCSSPALAREIPPPNEFAPLVDAPASVGDGTAFVCVVTGDSLKKATVTFLDRTVTGKPDPKDPGRISFLVPVPLDRASGTEALTWTAEDATGRKAAGRQTVTVVKKIYPIQRLTLAPKYVTPDPALKERIDRERKTMGKALTTRTSERFWTLPMLRPVPGKVTSWYGLRRVLNDQPRAPHRGLDFRAAEGDPIACVADGKVVLTGDFYYSGMFALVDHGLGVLSIYMHMSKILVSDGQTLSAGDTVGLVGSTGRSTAPHLHLGIHVLGQSIDPLPLLAMTDEDRAAYEKAFSDAAREEKKPARKKAPAKKSPKKSAARTPRKTQ